MPKRNDRVSFALGQCMRESMYEASKRKRERDRADNGHVPFHLKRNWYGFLNLIAMRFYLHKMFAALIEGNDFAMALK